jgi:hypothetical protein
MQRVLKRRPGAGLRRRAIRRTVPNHLNAAELKGRERDGEVDIVGIVGERLGQHRLCRLEALVRGFHDGGGSLLDDGIGAVRRPGAGRGRLRVAIEQFADAHRQQMTDTGGEPGLLQRHIGVFQHDRHRRGPHDFTGCGSGHACADVP